MNRNQILRLAAQCVGASLGAGAAVYAAYAGVTWWTYGKRKQARGQQSDQLLDMFMPDYEVIDRHAIRIDAPAEVALSAAAGMDLESRAVIRAIFRTREWILRSKPDDRLRPRGLIREMKFLGWGVLAEITGVQIVMGAVTQPWNANPVFRALPPEEFASFDEPGYVKIIWTLRADPAGKDKSVFRTETRAVATDPESRKKFRRYWSWLSPGIVAIRVAMLPAVKADAEKRRRNIAA